MDEVVWFKPEQVDELREACYSCSYDRLQARNEALIALMYDTGVRVGEATKLRTGHFRPDEGHLFLPTEIQKDYPNEGSPPPATLELQRDTTQTLKRFLKERWKDSEYLFPSVKSPDMTTQAVRDMFKKVAEVGEVDPIIFDPKKGWDDGEPRDITTHSMRHSVAYRMLVVEDKSIYDVMRRLRHARIQTTVSTYAHFDTA